MLIKLVNWLIVLCKCYLVNNLLSVVTKTLRLPPHRWQGKPYLAMSRRPSGRLLHVFGQ